MGPSKRLLIALGLALLLPAGAFAQDEFTQPEVHVEDADFADPIVPREEQGVKEIQIAVGCQTPEAPETSTLVTIQPKDAPAWVQLVVDPAVLQWQTEVGDCPAPEPPFNGTATVSITLSPDAPAFEQASFALEATVQKIGPDEEENSYGPYQASVNVTPGYLHDQELDVEQPSQDVAHDEEVTFEGTLTHEGNGEATYEITAGDSEPASNVTIEPAEVQLAPGAQSSFEVTVGLAETSIEEDTTVEVPLTATGEPTHPDAEEGGSEEITLQATFLAPVEEETDEDVPGPGFALLVASLALVAGSTRRQRR